MEKKFLPTQKNGRLKIATARAGNVIGGGDWSQNRLIPDSIKALLKKEKIKLEIPILLGLGNMFLNL